jgi:hypothetical protein
MRRAPWLLALWPLVACLFAGCPAQETCATAADCGDGEVCSLSLCVRPEVPDTVVIESFSADPAIIPPGSTSTLTWRTRNARACVLDPGASTVPRTGSVPVSPGVSTNYTLRCEGSGGPVEASTLIAVDAALFDAGPDAGDAGIDPEVPQLTGDVRLIEANELIPVPPPDAGPDAGAPVDAGPVTDAGPEVDAGPPIAEVLLFREQEAVVLAQPTGCNAHLPGPIDVDNQPIAQCRIAPDATVDVWFAMTSPDDRDATLSGSITFPRPVVALLYGAARLDDTDDEFGVEDVPYPTGDAGRGVATDTTDSLALSADRRTLTFSFDETGLDSLRVLTMAAGEPMPLVRTNNTDEVTAPADLNPGVLQSDTVVRLIDEGTGSISPATGLDVDQGSSATVTAADELVGATLPEATALSSYTVFFDPVAVTAVEVDLTMTLPGRLMGVMVSDDALLASDADFGLAGITYPTPRGGLDFGLGGRLIWHDDDQSVSLHLAADTGVVAIRLLYEP